jgi:hypothetical protein
MSEQYLTGGKPLVRYSRNMAEDQDIKILSIEQDGDDGLMVTFSDGTVGGYLAEELLELRPHRDQSNKPAEVS